GTAKEFGDAADGGAERTGREERHDPGAGSSAVTSPQCITKVDRSFDDVRPGDPRCVPGFGLVHADGVRVVGRLPTDDVPVRTAVAVVAGGTQQRRLLCLR